MSSTPVDTIHHGARKEAGRDLGGDPGGADEAHADDGAGGVEHKKRYSDESERVAERRDGLSCPKETKLPLLQRPPTLRPPPHRRRARENRES